VASAVGLCERHLGNMWNRTRCYVNGPVTKCIWNCSQCEGRANYVLTDREWCIRGLGRIIWQRLQTQVNSQDNQAALVYTDRQRGRLTNWRRNV